MFSTNNFLPTRSSQKSSTPPTREKTRRQMALRRDTFPPSTDRRQPEWLNRHLDDPGSKNGPSQPTHGLQLPRASASDCIENIPDYNSITDYDAETKIFATYDTSNTLLRLRNYNHDFECNSGFPPRYSFALGSRACHNHDFSNNPLQPDVKFIITRTKNGCISEVSQPLLLFRKLMCSAFPDQTGTNYFLIGDEFPHRLFGTFAISESGVRFYMSNKNNTEYFVGYNPFYSGMITENTNNAPELHIFNLYKRVIADAESIINTEIPKSGSCSTTIGTPGLPTSPPAPLQCNGADPTYMCYSPNAYIQLLPTYSQASMPSSSVIKSCPIIKYKKHSIFGTLSVIRPDTYPQKIVLLDSSSFCDQLSNSFSVNAVAGFGSKSQSADIFLGIFDCGFFYNLANTSQKIPVGFIIQKNDMLLTKITGNNTIPLHDIMTNIFNESDLSPYIIPSNDTTSVCRHDTKSPFLNSSTLAWFIPSIFAVIGLAVCCICVLKNRRSILTSLHQRQRTNSENEMRGLNMSRRQSSRQNDIPNTGPSTQPPEVEDHVATIESGVGPDSQRTPDSQGIEREAARLETVEPVHTGDAPINNNP